MPTPIARVTFILLASAAYFSLATLGWGSFVAFFAHPALAALALATAAMVVASLFVGGNSSHGVREDRSNRWVLIAFSRISLRVFYLPVRADRRDLRTPDGGTIRWRGTVLSLTPWLC